MDFSGSCFDLICAAPVAIVTAYVGALVNAWVLLVEILR